MYFLEFNNYNNEDLGLKITDRTILPVPIKKYKSYDIDGSTTYNEENGYEDLEVSVTFNFLEYEQKEHGRISRLIRKWLLHIKDHKLRFSDDYDYYYRVKKVNIDEGIERSLYVGVFTVTFIVEPYQYAYDGSIDVPLKSGDVLYNLETENSEPIFTVIGQGLFNLNVNDKQFQVNVGGKAIIDTEELLVYKEDGTIIRNTKGEFPILKVGTNKITFTDGFIVNVKTNYRSI